MQIIKPLKISIDSTGAVKSIKDLNTEVKNTSTNLNGVNSSLNNTSKSIDNTAKSTQSLKAQLRAMTQELQGLEPGSARFNELSTAAGQLRDQIQDTNAVINATAGSAVENLSGAFTKVAGIGVSAFQGIAGAQAIFGSDSEELMKIMTQLQGAMALGQALKDFGALGDTLTEIKASAIAAAQSMGLLTVATEAETVATEGATIAQEGLNTAIKANPIGIILVGITALVGAIALFNSATKENTEEQKRNEFAIKARDKAQKEQIKTIAEESSKFVGLIYQLKETNKGSKERSDLIKEINKEYGTTLKNLSDETEFQKLLNKEVEDYIAFQEVKLRIQQNEKAFQGLLKQKIDLQTQINILEKEAQQNTESLGGSVERGIFYTQEQTKSLNSLQNQLTNVTGKLTNYTKRIVTLKDNQNELTDGGKKYVDTNKEVAKSVDNVSEQEKLLIETQEKRIELNKTINEDIKKTAFELVKIRRAEGINEIAELLNNRDEKEKLINEDFKKSEKLAQDEFNLSKKTKADIDKLNADKTINEIQRKERLILLEKQFNSNIKILQQEALDEKFKLDLDSSEKEYENKITVFNKLQEQEINQVQKEITSNKDRNEAIKKIEDAYFELRKNATQEFFESNSTILRIGYEQESGLIDEQIKQTEGFYERKQQVVKFQASTIADIEKKLLTTTDKEQKLQLENQLKKAQESLTESQAVADAELAILTELYAKKENLDINYNSDVQKLASETTDKLKKEEEERTKNSEEERKKQTQKFKDLFKDVGETWDNDWPKILNRITEFAVQIGGQITGLLSQLFSQLNEQANFALREDNRIRTEALNDALAQRIITQEEYDARVNELNNQQFQKEREIKRKQFAQDKALRLSSAIMLGAQAVVAALTLLPPASFVLAAINGALTAAQIGIISSQKFTAARGGIVPGNAPSTIDSVPSMLAPGEMVINSNSASMFPTLLSEINKAGGGISLAPEPLQSLTSQSTNIFESNQQIIKAFVVESELSGAQRRVSRMESSATY